MTAVKIRNRRRFYRRPAVKREATRMIVEATA